MMYKLKQLFNKQANSKSEPQRGIIPFPVNKALFYTYNDYEFASHYFDLMNKKPKSEQPDVNQLDDIQKVLLYFPSVIGQIGNGGFWQVFFNGYEKYVKESIAGLKQLGEDEVANILELIYAQHMQSEQSEKNAEELNTEYQLSSLSVEELEQVNHELILKSYDYQHAFQDKLREEGFSMDLLLSVFYDKDLPALDKAVKYIKDNKMIYCVDEQGNPFDLDFTGTYRNQNDYDTNNYEMSMKNGKPDGQCRIYNNKEQLSDLWIFENGKPIEHKHYYNGELKHILNLQHLPDFIIKTEFKKDRYDYEDSNEIKKYQYQHHPLDQFKKIGKAYCWRSDGSLKHEFDYAPEGSTFPICKKFYYPNGNLRSEYIESGDRTTYTNVWNEDGSYHNKAVFDDDGNYLYNIHYYPDGRKKQIVIQTDNDSMLDTLDYWDEKGSHIIKEGQGVLDTSYRARENTYRSIRPIINTKTHGTYQKFVNEVLVEQSEWFEGKKHGFEQYFDLQGQLTRSVQWENGKRHGLEEFFAEGKLTTRKTWYKGEQVSHEQFNH